MAWMYKRTKVWDTGITINGFLAGLVAITCPCYWVSPTGAIIIGGIAGVVCIWGIDFLEWLRVDDPIGAVAVHGFAGIWGTISLGLFASGYGLTGSTGPNLDTKIEGLFYGGGTKQLVAQVTGSVVITSAALAAGFVLMFLVKMTKTLRISEAGEIEGIDIHEHGGPAYRPEPQYIGQSPSASADPDHAGGSISLGDAAPPRETVSN